MFEPVHIRYSRRKALGGLVSLVVLTLLFLYSSREGRWYWVAYVVLLLFNGLYIFRALFNREVVLTIDDYGVLDHRRGGVHIPWSRIEGVSLHHGERIFLEMSDTSHLGWEEHRLSVFNRPIVKLGKPGLLIDTRGLEYGIGSIAEKITDRMNDHRGMYQQ